MTRIISRDKSFTHAEVNRQINAQLPWRPMSVNAIASSCSKVYCSMMSAHGYFGTGSVRAEALTFSGQSPSRDCAARASETSSVKCQGRSAYLLWTKPFKRLCSTCERNLISLTSPSLLLEHWPFWIGRSNMFENSFFVPRKLGRTKSTMHQYSMRLFCEFIKTNVSEHCMLRWKTKKVKQYKRTRLAMSKPNGLLSQKLRVACKSLVAEV